MTSAKSNIIKKVQQIAAANGGKVPGQIAFAKETGIKRSDWFPHFWLRWGDALLEAGFAPNKLTERLDEEFVLQKYAELIEELGRIPVDGELVLKRKRDESFPYRALRQRFGGKNKLIEALLPFCESHPELETVAGLCRTHLNGLRPSNDLSNHEKGKISVGFVYLMKSGKHYKIGKTNSVIRRHGELKIQIPVPPTSIHNIETDDPSGVEAYWHRRFSDRRGEGEWFTLSADDVTAFKRWKRLI